MILPVIAEFSFGPPLDPTPTTRLPCLDDMLGSQTNNSIVAPRDSYILEEFDTPSPVMWERVTESLFWYS